MTDIARRARLSRSLVSRMLSDTVKQKRINPTLDTMLRVIGAVEALTGTRIGLDALAGVIRGG